MKKHRIRLFVFALVSFLLFAQPVLANSGPTFWQGYPAFEVLAIDENCPIGVEEEKLVFDLRGDNRGDYTIGGQVTASYQMVNPTDQAISVQMAFPYISNLYDFTSDDMAIMAEETPLPYDVYIGDVVNGYRNPIQQENQISVAFDDIVSTITNEQYQAANFSADEKGQLYTIQVKPTTEQSIKLAVEFKMDSEKTNVLTNGFNGYGRDGQKATLTAWGYEPRELEIFVMGEQVDFNITGYIDGQLEKTSNLFTYQIITKEVDHQTYIMDSIDKYVKKMEHLQTPDLQTKIQNQQLYNVYAAALDSRFTENAGMTSFDELIAQNESKRILTMVYTVDFPANSRRNIQVSYKTRGTMDQTKTAEPVYTFNYLLNPAKNWNHFQQLDIQIFTPESAPYIVNSNIELNEQKERYYTASLEALPDSDFFFSIYANQKISTGDRVYGALKNTFGYFLPLIIVGAFVFVLIGLSIWAIRKRYSRK